jgi:Zn-dependent protease
MFFEGMDLTTIIARVIILLTAFSVHEFAHAWTADRLGDATPRMNGRLTLNPLAHLDPIGSLMLLFAGFGWARPVPINPYALSRRSPAAVMWVSLAGPGSNFLMAVVGAVVFRVIWAGVVGQNLDYSSSVINFIIEFLLIFIITNLGLMLFNLLPLFPLDGDKIFDYFVPPAWARAWESIRPYGSMILLVAVLAGQFLGIDLFGAILGPPMRALFDLLTGI